jgi:WD40 repeat protein
MLASVSNNLINLWDLKSGQLQQSLKGHLTAIYSLAFSREGDVLASGDYHGTVKLWDIKEAATEDILRHADNVNCVAFSPHNMTLASGSQSGELTLWDVSKSGSKRPLKHGSPFVTAVSFSPDGNILASSYKTVKLWNVASGDLVSEFPQDQIVWSMAFAPDGKTLALGRADGVLTLLESTTGATKDLPGHGDSVFAFAFSPDGETLASSCAHWGSSPVSDHSVRLWNWRSGRLEKVLAGHTYGVPALAFSPCGDTLVTASGDGTMRVWDWSRGKELHRIEIAKHDHQRATFSPDGRCLILASGGRPVQFWDATTWKLRFQLPTHNVRSMVLSSDGTVLATGGDDDTVRLHRIATHEEVQETGW